MSVAATHEKARVGHEAGHTITNDVVITVATANGTGSQSANLILMRSIFNMGIPVSGKNLFPSNIQGLPTWFTIRANDAGWTARRDKTDFLVAMNPETVERDLEQLQPGAYVVLRDTLKGFVKRDDLNVTVAPFDKMIRDLVKEVGLRKKVINMMYVGVMSHLLGMDTDAIDRAIERQFGGKKKAIEVNKEAMVAAIEWAKENVPRQEEFRLQTSNATQGKIIIEGNEAAALGAMFGGATVCAWYPITPSSSLAEFFIAHMDRHRRDPETGARTYAVVQAEDELSSIAMVVGAGWAGARAFTTTSGPGISLMGEIAGLSYFAEIPAVIMDVQRVGPSTGLPTRTCQGDIAKAYYLSHGDCKHVLLIPGSVKECFEFAAESFNLAEELQTLVFVMCDLDMGMNNWMSDPFEYPETPINRGKVLDAAALDKVKEFARYKDVDGDGIPYRTLPGTPHPKAGYFTRGTGHNEYAGYSEYPEDWEANMRRLVRKFDTARTKVPQPALHETGQRVGIIAYGSSDPAVLEARTMLEGEGGLKTDYLRIRALPVSDVVREFIERHDIVYLVEQNRDAQVMGILRAEYPDLATKLESILHFNGLPIDARTIANAIVKGEGAKS